MAAAIIAQVRQYPKAICHRPENVGSGIRIGLLASNRHPAHAKSFATRFRPVHD
ncbi:hypothetical protein QWY79_11465 [Halomonas sabkhae]|uniref:hypothetical protein n=1 Tax=Halomonas sabkhae TaxID=626223 RepID=UPI0025B4601F|nr:hypothetical protein [Halomonas sabkhae]MDN3525880.1 hypothetical protein [Halomonas sabkhae]